MCRIDGVGAGGAPQVTQTDICASILEGVDVRGKDFHGHLHSQILSGTCNTRSSGNGFKKLKLWNTHGAGTS